MSPLSIPFIYYSLSQYLTIKDIIKLGETCKELNILTSNEEILKFNHFKVTNINIKLKDYMIMSFLKNSRTICGICKKNMILNVVLSFHNCSILKKCIRCNDNDCTCDKITYYHKECVEYDNHFFKCPLCNQLALGFELRINI